ncbi:MAG TPA: helix-turn-helix transcriptional regulator [Chitinophagaceae bacterium]|nr:helix-turn-helix transcriptional regulator [Chitinophagaceae bacterium]
MFNLSIPTLRRQFQKYFQIPIYRYISRERMEYAKRLLLGYTHTINEISELVGYSEPSSFTHAFTNYFGVAPSRFSLKSDFDQSNYY